MAKTRVQKEEMVKKLDEQISKMKSAVLIDYKGLKVRQSEELRKLLREKGAEFSVAKNTLVKLALKKSGIEYDEGVFTKPVAIAFAMDDEVAPAKEIALFAKKNEALEILGGILEKKYLDSDAIKRLALLPTKDELRGKLVGTIAAPLSGMVNVFAGNIRGVVNVLNALKEKKA